MFQVGEHGPERIDVKPFVDLITHWTQIVKNERMNWFKELSRK